MKRHGTVRLLALLALFSLPFFTGCDADDPVVPETVGTCVIDLDPDAIDAPWFLLGSDSYQASGNGDAVLSDLNPGEYYVYFGPVDGWISPLSTDATLVAGERLTFTGLYVEDPSLPFPGSENQLMANFRTTYEDMNVDTMADLLHADFITILQPSTVQEFPDVGPTLDLTEEMRIAERMFSGQPVTDPDGALVQAISDITFNIFEQVGHWADSPPNDVIPNARFALFDVTVLFDRPGASTLKVTGQIKFYATSRDSVVDGLTKAYWQMIGQQDLTNGGKAIEGEAWGAVKALFR